MTSEAALRAAWETVFANRGAAGGDGVTVERFARRAGVNLKRLGANLRDGWYRPAELRRVAIPKPRGGERVLAIPAVIDRVAQAAAARTLTPVFDPGFSRHSYGYRRGRSVQQVVRAIGRMRREGYGFVAEADIARCFDQIPHDPLNGLIEARLAGRPGAEGAADLIALWLEHFGAEFGTPGRGLAQGSPLSPLLANLYLDQLDDALEAARIRIVRYADDFVLLAKTEAAAHRALLMADDVLGAHGLELKDEKTRVVSFDRGFVFLGHLFLRSMALKQVNDPEENPLEALRAVAAADEDAAAPSPPDEPDERPSHRVLHIGEKGRRLGLRNMSFTVDEEEAGEIAAIHHDRVARIEIGPLAAVETEALRHALATDTEIAFVSSGGETLGWLHRPEFDRAALHLAQARMALDAARAADLARRIVEGRMRNQRAQLSRLNRSPKDAEAIVATKTLGRMIRKLPQAADVAALRGAEGAAAAVYWPALGLLAAHAPQPFRRRRPATDPLNAAINYLTAMLARDVRSAILRAGLHPGFGVLHRPRDGSEACVYDLMEGFRAPLTEGLAATLFNQGRLKPEMFTGGRMNRRAVKAVIVGYERAAARLVRSAHSGRRRSWRRVMQEEAVAYGRHCADPWRHPFEPQIMDY